jgi:hypothetical protein
MSGAVQQLLLLRLLPPWREDRPRDPPGARCVPPAQPMEIYVDDEAKLTLHGLVQHYIMLNEEEKNRKLNDLLDALDFNQVLIWPPWQLSCLPDRLMGFALTLLWHAWMEWFVGFPFKLTAVPLHTSFVVIARQGAGVSAGSRSGLTSIRGAWQVVIFVKSVARAKELNKLLVECNFPSICIHSAQKQEERCAPASISPLTCMMHSARLARCWAYHWSAAVILCTAFAQACRMRAA